LLIKRNDMQLASEYPLLTVAPNLNGTKYPALRLPMSICTDVESVQHILKVLPPKRDPQLPSNVAAVPARPVAAASKPASASLASSSSAAANTSVAPYLVSREYTRLIAFSAGPALRDVVAAVTAFSRESAAENRSAPSFVTNLQSLTPQRCALNLFSPKQFGLVVT
jgi:hypothetical protein